MSAAEKEQGGRERRQPRKNGRLTGSTSKKLSVRVDPGLMSAAADSFVQWFMTTEDRLPEDFEIAV